MKISFNIKKTGKVIGLLLAGIFLGWLFFGGSSADQPVNMDEHVQEAHTDKEGNIVYTCSMHPSVRESEPGNCPICGMKLIPVSGSDAASEENPYELTMTQAAMKLAEVQTTEVVKDVAVNKIRMPGKVKVDERNIASVTAQFPGRIEQLYVDFTGQRVAKGEKLASVYSPKLVSAQKELIEAQKYKESNPALYKAARKKLELWELPQSAINTIEQSGEVKTTMDIVSPVTGYVIKRNVTREDYVNTGTMMYQIADLSKVWVTFDAFESDLMGLEVEDEVSFTIDAYPGESFKAEITYIDPVLDPQSRTVSVRAETDNPDGRLKPQMLAEGVISSRVYGGEEQILVPKSAVLWTGERSVVYVKKPNTKRPTFEFREVVLGPRVGDKYVIKSGVEPGEEVVTNGNFKIDSAAQLAGKASMMNRKPGMEMDGDMENNSSKIKMEQTSQKIFPESNNPEVEADKAQVSDVFKEQLDRFVNAYLPIKDALTKDDLQVAASGVNNLNEALSGIDMNLIENDKQMQAWMTRQEALKKHIDAVEQAEDLDEFRRQFALLSEALAETLTTFGVERLLYVQYCPMARDGEGAYWVSSQEEIVNPYMGQSMPECGETQKSFSPAKDG